MLHLGGAAKSQQCSTKKEEMTNSIGQFVVLNGSENKHLECLLRRAPTTSGQSHWLQLCITAMAAIGTLLACLFWHCGTCSREEVS